MGTIKVVDVGSGGYAGYYTGWSTFCNVFRGCIWSLCATSGTPVDMKGTIIGICQNSSQPTCDMPDSMLVEGVLTSGNQNGNVSVKITNETQIFRKMEMNLFNPLR